MQRLISSEQAIGGMMMEHKRCPITFEESSITTLKPKRHKADLSLTSKEKKEKVGERIAALQQLVSPYGKTDTASVLLEAMEYITFLHEQVKVLSAPYLCGSPTSNTLVRLEWLNSAVSYVYSVCCHFFTPEGILNSRGVKMIANDMATIDPEPYSLRSKGLCLVPVSCTIGVASSNGADIWAPIKTSSPKF